jgi:hypothetical protein
MTTNQLGIPISQHRYPPAPRRPNPSVSSPPGAKTSPNRQPSAPNKPNNRPSRPENADPPRKTNPNKPNIGARRTPVSPLKSQISNPQPCAAPLSSSAPNKPNRRRRPERSRTDLILTALFPFAPNKPNCRSVHFVISGSCEMRYAKSGRQARVKNKPNQTQLAQAILSATQWSRTDLANPARRYAPRWQDRPIPRIMPRLSTRRRMDNG